MIEFHDGRCVFGQCAAAYVQRGCFVLLERSRDGFTLPGVKVELLEHSSSAIERKLWEKLRVPVRINRLLWVVERFFDYRQHHVHQTLFVFQLSVDEIVPYHRLRENELSWWPVNLTHRLRLYPDFLQGKLSYPPEAVEHLCLK